MPRSTQARRHFSRGSDRAAIVLLHAVPDDLMGTHRDGLRATSRGLPRSARHGERCQDPTRTTRRMRSGHGAGHRDRHGEELGLHVLCRGTKGASRAYAMRSTIRMRERSQSRHRADADGLGIGRAGFAMDSGLVVAAKRNRSEPS